MIAKRLPRNNVKFRAEVVQINLEEKIAKTRDDVEIKSELQIIIPIPEIHNHSGRNVKGMDIIYINFLCRQNAKGNGNSIFEKRELERNVTFRRWNDIGMRIS